MITSPAISCSGNMPPHRVAHPQSTCHASPTETECGPPKRPSVTVCCNEQSL
ncbi:hypothetical protein BDZ91DRAFT_473319 [Kalaharituber pfeilii]|nr:hypothetical protein BDZ91DRAFT_473319 [Kalaharituber pfeilii]